MLVRATMVLLASVVALSVVACGQDDGDRAGGGAEPEGPALRPADVKTCFQAGTEVREDQGQLTDEKRYDVATKQQGYLDVDFADIYFFTDRAAREERVRAEAAEYERSAKGKTVAQVSELGLANPFKRAEAYGNVLVDFSGSQDTRDKGLVTACLEKAGAREPLANVVKVPRPSAADGTQAKRPDENASSATGPRTCPSKDGVGVVVNAGGVSCDEATDLVGNSRGPNNAQGPEGWDCSGLARDARGKELSAVDGYQCRREDDAVSILAAGVDTGGAEEAGTPQGAFASPSGNIICANDGSALECVVGGTPPAYSLTPSGRPRRASALDNPGLEPSPLAYGQSTTILGIRCESETAGVTCRNRAGHGFFLSKENQRLF